MRALDALTAKLPAVGGYTEATQEERGRLPDTVCARTGCAPVCRMRLGNYL